MKAKMLVAAGALALSACGTLPPARTEIPPRPARDTIASFVLEGRIGVRNEQESFSGGLSWQHAPRSDLITLNSPLGQALAELRIDEAGAVLETSDRKRHEAPDADALSEQVFRFRLPVRALPDWVLGRPSGPGARMQTDSQGRLASLTEDAWRVEYTEYENDSPDALPLALSLEQGNIRVRLKIDQWMISR